MMLLLCLIYFLLPSHMLCAKQEEPHCPSIAVVVNSFYRGERALAERLKIACERLDWEVQLLDIGSFKTLAKKVDWTLIFVPHVKPNSHRNCYLVLFDPEHHYFDSNGHLSKEYLRYAGFLAAYEPPSFFLKDLGYDANRFYPKRWYPTVQYRPYHKVEPERLFYFFGHWGERYFHNKYKKMQVLLAEKSYTNFYGCPSIGQHYGKAYRGEIGYQGEEALNRISEMGVCLILHSETHLKHRIPSGRIFEAAAASAVIISDLNDFVLENFGNSVLYIDQTRSGEEIFEQIDAHMNWIRKNRDEALDMARRAHQIFEERFLLEDQLLDFNRFFRSCPVTDS